MEKHRCKTVLFFRLSPALTFFACIFPPLLPTSRRLFDLFRQ